MLLDGQGMDEQWAGYDYYRRALNVASASLIQGTMEITAHPEGLTPEFRSLAERFEVNRTDLPAVAYRRFAPNQRRKSRTPEGRYSCN